MNRLLRIPLCALLCTTCAMVCPAQSFDALAKATATKLKLVNATATHPATADAEPGEAHAPMPQSRHSPTLVVTWTAGSGTDHNWSNAFNWSPNLVPNGKMYDVVITNPDSFSVTQDISATVHNLTLKTTSPYAQLYLGDGISLTIVGTKISNAGSIVMNNDGGATTSLIINGTVTHSGGGFIFMTNKSVIDGSGTLINQANISAAGTGNYIGPNLELQNIGQGHIGATGPGCTLNVNLSGTLTNSGYLSAGGNNSTLVLAATTIQNTNGQILGGPGTVMLNGGTIIGGYLNGGIQPLPGGSAPTLKDLDIFSTYQITSNTGTYLEGKINNYGNINVNDTDPKGTSKAHLTLNSTATLTGGGTVSLNGPNNYLDGTGTLTNQQTIYGTGNIELASVINKGTIDAGGSTLNIQSVGLKNYGGIILTSESAMASISGGTITGGTLLTGQNSMMTWTGGLTLKGVNINGSGVDTGVKVVLDGTGKSLTDSGTVHDSSGAITNSGTVEIDNGDQTTLMGTINNTGEIFVNASCFSCGNATLLISGSASLTGTGTVSMANSPYNIIQGATGSDTLNNNGNTIEGAGNIGNGLLNVTNGVKGTIYANQGYPLIIQPGAGYTFNNSGTLATAAPNSRLDVTGGTFSNFNSNTGTLTGGKYNVSGTLQFDNANILNSAANITLGAPTAQILNQNNVNGLLNFSNNLSGGSFTLAGGENFTTQGLFTNAGSVTAEKSSTFTVGGTSTNYNQTGGTTTVDGTLAVPAGGLVNATGGTLQGAGTFSGSVSLGNASGAAATLIVGDSIKKAGLVSISDNYTQLATGVLDTQIGGRKVGTSYSQLSVTGPVTLDGTLNISLIKKFTPAIGQKFTILNAPSGITGTFSTVNGLAINSSEHFTLSYTSTTVVLEVVPGPCCSR